MKKQIMILVLVLGFLSPAFLEAAEFSKKEAFEHVKILASEIGPRTMGSPQEKAALTYTAEKLAEYGCQVEWQSVSRSEKYNTESYNVFGRFPGLTDREIVVGAHIDSGGPEIPGANDDASGVAVVLELARILCQGSHHSTLVFVAFCGEESGLVGSKHFVEHYPLENVALMLQLDMASNDSPLMLWPDSREHHSPKWLVSASIDAFHALGYRNIDYPPHFGTFNKATIGAGSDHEPFMGKGIPAIAFVSDVRFPIHTRNDSVEYFQVDGLERSGRLAMELIERFDQGQPEEKEDHYMLVMIGEKPIFIPLYLITVFIMLSVITAIFALYFVRKRGPGPEEEKRIRMSWPKLVVDLLIVLLVTCASLWTMQLLKGQHVPWYTHPGPHFWYAIPFFVLGVWVALQTRRIWKLRRRPFFYLIRTVVYLAVFIVLFWLFRGPRLALYPASGLFFISLGCLVPWGWLKGLLWVMSPYMMIRLVLIPEYYEFLYRGIAHMGLGLIKSSGETYLLTVGLILFIILWSMPFMLGFAAVYRSHSGDLFWLKRFRKGISLVPILVVIVGGAFYLYTLPSYSSTWEQEVSVIQKYDGEKDKTYIEFSSGDYLKGITASFNGRQEKMDMKSGFKRIEVPLEMDWIKDKSIYQSEDEETNKIVNLDMTLEFERQPYTVTLKLKSDEDITVEECNLQYKKKKNRVAVSWYSFPKGILQPRLKLRLAKEAQLKVEIFASFLDTPLEISCEGENMHFIHRAEIAREIDLSQE